MPDDLVKAIQQALGVGEKLTPEEYAKKQKEDEQKKADEALLKQTQEAQAARQKTRESQSAGANMQRQQQRADEIINDTVGKTVPQ